jgi:hypothetical protein
VPKTTAIQQAKLGAAGTGNAADESLITHTRQRAFRGLETRGAILVAVQVVYPRSGNWLELTRLACLVQEMTNGDTSHARIAAANAILDRA